MIYLPSARQDGDPEAAAARADVRRLLERAVDQLPEHFRLVFMLRDIEEMSVEETASHLGLRPETVKTTASSCPPSPAKDTRQVPQVSHWRGVSLRRARCARITEAVLERLGLPEHREE